MKQILAFGDSNTWGLVPGSKTRERYPWGVRWTSLLQEKYEDVRVAEEGLCGRTTVFEDELRPGRKGSGSLEPLIESQYPIDGAILMLGTNDCKTYYHASSYVIGKGIERCLDILEKYVAPENILLVSPIHLGDDVWKPEKDPEFGARSVETSRELKKVYRDIARKRGTRFLAASDYVKPSSVDDEHMDEAGHRAFAEVVYRKLENVIS
ncbi:GDSL-type esterase/lipase family protein [Butyrivibrio sp. FCS014]|uniref:GDSL-type esterase/lipase family protein n=1 Tax=Butyrivibrio sp. FCS014 TaxID=1408304 RepID=UPI0004662F03|nr:GDSL-type esterase/lipase family protein [Butyrivibrio sp. FCS014]